MGSARRPLRGCGGFAVLLLVSMPSQTAGNAGSSCVSMSMPMMMPVSVQMVGGMGRGGWLVRFLVDAMCFPDRVSEVVLAGAAHARAERVPSFDGCHATPYAVFVVESERFFEALGADGAAFAYVFRISCVLRRVCLGVEGVRVDALPGACGLASPFVGRVGGFCRHVSQLRRGLAVSPAEWCFDVARMGY